MRRCALVSLLVALTFPVVAVEGAPARRYELPLQGSPSLGPADAAVTLVEFLDFQ